MTARNVTCFKFLRLETLMDCVVFPLDYSLYNLQFLNLL